MTCTSTSASMTHAYEPVPVARGYRAVSLDTLDMVARINRACREHGIAVSMFGRAAVGDPRLFSDLMNGRSLRPGTEAKVRAFIASLGEA